MLDVEKCKKCPRREGYYKECEKIKTYSVTIKSDVHLDQINFQERDYFKEKFKERYKIEAKNSELKHRRAYDVVSSSGIIGIEIQVALAIFTVNLKRILKLINEKQIIKYMLYKKYEIRNFIGIFFIRQKNLLKINKFFSGLLISRMFLLFYNKYNERF